MDLPDNHQIDLDGTDDDIKDIQQEIALLSTCSSPFVTRYKTSFVRGVKLWIVMEYLGGGSCLDLVSIREANKISAITNSPDSSKFSLSAKCTLPSFAESCC